MTERINQEDFELINEKYKNILDEYKNNDIYIILKHGYDETLNMMNKKFEECEYYINYKDIRIDIFLFPLVKYLIDNCYEIKSCSYYRSKNNYCNITFSSINSGLMFIDKNIIIRNVLYKRVESSSSVNIKNKWFYYICPYVKYINSNKSSQNDSNLNNINLSFTLMIPNDDIILLYNILNNKKNIIIPHNLYNNVPLFKRSKKQLIDYIDEINKIKINYNNIIINKILDKSINFVYKSINKLSKSQTILKFDNSSYKINDKLIPLIKELLIAKLEINDDECYYDDTFSNICCISFPFYANVIEFINIIIMNKDHKNEFYKRILNLSNKGNWIYETCIIDINIKNKQKPDFFPSINIKFNIDDLQIAIDTMIEYNKKNDL
jgi:hypothetical protein